MDALSIGPSVTATLIGSAVVTDVPALRTSDKHHIASTAVGVNGTTNTYVAANALFADYQINDVILVAGFVNGANNGRKKVISKTVGAVNTDLGVSDTALTTEVAGASAVIDKLRLPSYVAILAPVAADASVRPWGVNMGTAPLAAVNMVLPVGVLVVLNIGSCDQIIVNGAAGSVYITALENG
jgi:hypothetical protein